MQLAEIEDSKKRRNEEVARFRQEGDSEIDQKFDRIDWVSPSINKCFLTFKRILEPSLLKKFLKIVTPELIHDIIQNFQWEDLVMCYSKAWQLSLTLHEIWLLLAVTIRIQGLRKVPPKNTKNQKPKKSSVEEAISHSKARSSLSNFQGIEAFEKS